MKQSNLTEIKEFLGFRLKKYQRLLQLDEEIEKLLHEDCWEQFEQLVDEKNKVIEVIAKQEEKVLSMIKKSEGRFQQQDFNWQVLYQSLTPTEQAELASYLVGSRTVLAKIEKKESDLKEKIKVEQDALSKQMGQVKKSKQAHNAYQQSNSDAVFFNRRR